MKESNKNQKEEKQAEEQAQKVDAQKAEETSESASGATEGAEKAEEKKETDADKIEALTKENADLKDQLLRRVADFDNYRKRMIKEKQDAFEYANTNLLQDLLDSLDNFDRTVDAAANATDVKSIVEGVKMVSGSLVSMLENKYGLTGYGKAGDSFNPDEHEAIGSMNGPVAEPVLKDVYLKGYKLKDKIIRHAKVMVTMPDGSVSAEETKADSLESAEEKK